MIRVTSPARIHISLLDMNGNLGRVDGGVGLALERPSTVVEVGPGAHHLAEFDYTIRMLPFKRNFSLKVKKRIPPHVGLGSETQLRLSIACALHEFFGKKYTTAKLARGVGRGGTSGVGVAAFGGGGFILDGGHSFGRGQEKESFLPSRASGASPAPTIANLPFPRWDVVLATPDVARGLSGKEEVSFFTRHCPIPEAEVERISRIILVKMLPAIVLEDIRLFGESIDLVKRTGFKARELAIQPPVVHEIIGAFEKIGHGASVSSFGPTVFAFSDRKDKTDDMVKVFDENFSGTLIKTKARNSGAKIERL